MTVVARRFKERLQGGEFLLGSWVTLTDPCVTELLCLSGLDFVVLDAEHTPFNPEGIIHHMMAAKGTETAPFVRVPTDDLTFIKYALDNGAAGIVLPNVREAAQVRDAAAACFYPPLGVRGFGPRRQARYGRDYGSYPRVGNDEVTLIAQVEHIGAVEGLEEILAVPGLSGIWPGQADLAASMGFINDMGNPKVIEAMETLIAKARKAGVPAGQLVWNSESALQWKEKGAQFISLANDVSLLTGGIDAMLSGTRKSLAK